MADVVVTGGGVCGLLTAMLLANDGHEVTMLERDPMEPPGDPEAAWSDWERRGVNQFRLGHFLLPRFREIADAELPEVVTALEAGGALRYNIIGALPDFVTGGHRDGDERFESITARRPVIEAAVARAGGSTPRLTIRRGIGVQALVTGADHLAGVPHVVGVRTDTGEELQADLVVDATGRRSPLPRWLAEAGAAPAHEELEDCGFVYFGRHLRSADGSYPPPFGPPLNPYGSISALVLPCDGGTWTTVLVASSVDAAMRRLKDEKTWESVIRELPTVAHWLDGEPIEQDIVVMAKIEDRFRRYVVDGLPVATGVVPVADSWACTNPSVGRGITMGLMHAVLLRDTLAKDGLDDPAAFVQAYDAATTDQLEPLYRDTLAGDRQRLAEMAAAIDGRPAPVVADDRTKRILGLAAAAATDPDLLRATAAMGTLLITPEEAFAQPGLLDRAAAAEVPPAASGPTRERLLGLVS